MTDAAHAHELAKACERLCAAIAIIGAFPSTTELLLLASLGKSVRETTLRDYNQEQEELERSRISYIGESPE